MLPSTLVLTLIVPLLAALVAAVSAIWGATHELYVKKDDGSRSLLPAGRTSIYLTVCGLLVAGIGGVANLRLKQTELSDKALTEQRAARAAEESERRRRESEEKVARERADERRKQEAQQLKAERRQSEEFQKTRLKLVLNELEAQRREQQRVTDERNNALRQLRIETRLYGKITAASMPLNSLTLEFTFQRVPAEIRSAIRSGLSHSKDITATEDFQDRNEHHEFDDDDVRTMIEYEKYRLAIHPFVNALSVGRFQPKQALLAVGFDERFSSILPIGWIRDAWAFGVRPDADEMEPDGNDAQGETSIDGNANGSVDNAKTRSTRSAAPSFPAGVFVRKRIEWTSGHFESPRPTIQISVRGEVVVVTVALDHASIDRSLLRYTQKSLTTAAFQDDLVLFTWSPSDRGELQDPDLADQVQLPFDLEGVHSSLLDVERHKEFSGEEKLTDWLDDNDAWRRKNAAWLRSNAAWLASVPSWTRQFQLRLVPNGVLPVSRSYDVQLSSSGYPVEGSREDEPRGYVRIWRARARK